jgi:hypothetical protein
MSDTFKEQFESYFKDFIPILSTKEGEWTVKGFIDVYKNIYTISIDTKVVSKIIELMLFPKILEFAKKYDYDMAWSCYQNHYPDITFINKRTGEKIALDLKSTYRVSKDKVNGMTLGAFTGYFRDRESKKNITFPYNQYSKHYILGVIYTRTDMYNAEKALSQAGITINNGQRDLLETYLSDPSEENLQTFFKSLRITDKGNFEYKRKLRESMEKK